MSFDAEKVRFTDEELDVGYSADQVVERSIDGLQLSDLDAVVSLVRVVNYIVKDANGDREVIARRLVTLASMLVRDNM